MKTILININVFILIKQKGVVVNFRIKALCASLVCIGFSTQILANDINAVEEKNLGDIVVTASGFEQTTKEAPASITVITAEELVKKSYRDVTDALKDVPGVVITGGGSSSDISIRGMGSAYTLIMVDGKKVDSRGTRPNSDGSGIEQGWLPPVEAIQRIEVVRGPMSGLYGSDAMGGVINIITKKTSSIWTGSVRTDMTIQEDSDAGNTYQSSFYVSGPIIQDKLGIRATGLYSHRDEDKIYNGRSEQKMRSGSATLSFTPDDNNTFDLEASRSIQNRNSSVNKSIENKPNKNGKYPTDSYSNYYRNLYSLTHRGYYENWSTHSYIQQEANENDTRKMKSTNTIFNTQNQLTLGSHHLSVGGRYQKEKIEDLNNKLSENGKKISNIDRYSWALFAEDEWKIADTFALTSSVRYDKDENFGSHVTPKLYGVFTPNDNWTIKGGVSTGYKTPSLRASSPNWGQGTGGGSRNGVIFGNPSLKPEKSMNTEISFLWSNDDKDINAGMTLFNSDFKNKITEFGICDNDPEISLPACSNMPKYSTYDFARSRTNVDKATMRGVEATFDWMITQDLKFNSNYTYTQSKQKSGEFKGKPLNQMPKHMVNIGLDWNYNEQLNYWSKMNFRSKTSEYFSRTSMKQGTPSYTFVDAGVSYQPNKNVQLIGGIYNIFDKKIRYSDYGTTLDGRRYNIGMTYKF